MRNRLVFFWAISLLISTLTIGVIISLLLQKNSGFSSLIANNIASSVGSSNTQLYISLASDLAQKDDVQTIQSALNLYATDHQGELPTYNSGYMLPLVDVDNIMTIGAPASKLDGISPTYINSIPLTPGNDEYRVGRLPSGTAMVATLLSDNTIYTFGQ